MSGKLSKGNLIGAVNSLQIVTCSINKGSVHFMKLFNSTIS